MFFRFPVLCFCSSACCVILRLVNRTSARGVAYVVFMCQPAAFRNTSAYGVAYFCFLTRQPPAFRHTPAYGVAHVSAATRGIPQYVIVTGRILFFLCGNSWRSELRSYVSVRQLSASVFAPSPVRQPVAWRTLSYYAADRDF